MQKTQKLFAGLGNRTCKALHVLPEKAKKLKNMSMDKFTGDWEGKDQSIRIKELYEKLGKRYTGSENVHNLFMEDE